MADAAWQLLIGDVRDRLADLPDVSVQTVVTSPPYWGLRDYGTDGQIGLEPTPAAFVATLIDVFRGVRRVLKDDGTIWLNLGDSYASGGTGRRDTSGDYADRRAAQFGSGRGNGNGPRTYQQRASPDGFKPKDLIGIPWRVAFALQADGWYLRSDIIWHKPNPMPESVTDRPTKAHEYVFLLAKRERYYYDSDAIAERTSENTHTRGAGVGVKNAGTAVGQGIKHNADYAAAINGQVTERNKRSVWTVTTQPYAEAHFATFPEALIEPCILAGSRPGDVVLDPFVGSGTTGVVAIRHGRRFVGIDVNAAYVELARQRIGMTAPLFAAEVTPATDDQLALWT